MFRLFVFSLRTDSILSNYFVIVNNFFALNPFFLTRHPVAPAHHLRTENRITRRAPIVKGFFHKSNQGVTKISNKIRGLEIQKSWNRPEGFASHFDTQRKPLKSLKKKVSQNETDPEDDGGSTKKNYEGPRMAFSRTTILLDPPWC